MSEHSDKDLPAGTPAGPAATHDALAGRNAPGEPVSMAIFAARRAELGLSYDDIASQLKFAPRLVEALEAGEFDKLPGRTFARGMLRSYAKLLKIDPAPYLARLGSSPAQASGADQAMALRAPVPFSEGGRHVNLVYTVFSCLILATVGYFAFDWYYEKGGPGSLAFVAPAREVPVAGAAPQGAAIEPATPSSPPAKPATFASAGPVPVPETTAPRIENPGASATQPKAPLPPGKGRIVMRFEKESWVEIKARNGQTLLSQLNPAGSEKTVEGDPPFRLTIGNAPNVHVTYNDQPVDLKPHFKVDVARLTLD